MTTEEKARAYDEALEDMRAIYPNLKGDAKLAVEHAFPELAESEDEKMINELQGFLDSFGADYFGTGEWQKFHDWLEKQKECLANNSKTSASEDERIRKELVAVLEDLILPDDQRRRFLAYLEKQKYNRMQPIYDNQESFESALDKAWKSYNDSGARIVDGCEDDYIECAYAKGFREGYLFGLEKQKENTWSEEDDAKVKVMCKEGELKPSERAWLKGLRNRVWKERKPAWSQEDERMRNALWNLLKIQYAQDYSMTDVGIKAGKFRDWLKSLPLDLKKRNEDVAKLCSNEWSEEDEEKLKAICTYLRDYSRLAKLGDKLRFNEYCDFLQSLRPQYHGDVTMTEAYKMGLEAGKASSWKPSEEHLSALLAIFNDPNNIGSQTCQLALTDLYEQLKRLM